MIIRPMSRALSLALVLLAGCAADRALDDAPDAAGAAADPATSELRTDEADDLHPTTHDLDDDLVATGTCFGSYWLNNGTCRQKSTLRYFADQQCHNIQPGSVAGAMDYYQYCGSNGFYKGITFMCCAY